MYPWVIFIILIQIIESQPTAIKMMESQSDVTPKIVGSPVKIANKTRKRKTVFS